MVYSNKSSHKQVNFFKKTQVKCGKIIAKRFPLNYIRIWGIKLCGFKKGKKVFHKVEKA